MTRLLPLLLLLLATGWLPAQSFPYTDPFTTPGALSGFWTQTSATPFSPLVIVSAGKVAPNTSSVQGAAIFTGGSISSNPSIQAAITYSSGNFSGLCLINTGMSGSCYYPALGQLRGISAGVDTGGVQCRGSGATPSGDIIQIGELTGGATTVIDWTTSRTICTAGPLGVGVLPAMLVDVRATSGDFIGPATIGNTVLVPPLLPPTFSNPSQSWNITFPLSLLPASAGSTSCYIVAPTTSTPTAATPGHCDQNTFSTPLPINGAATVCAIATQVGFTNSAVVCATYTNPPFYYPAGTYHFHPIVTFFSNYGDVHVYTTDGSTPTANGSCAATHGTLGDSTTVASSLTVKFIGCQGGTSSSPQTAAYVIGSPTTWYAVGPGSSLTGGPRYDVTDNPTGTCDGTAYANPSGSTPNQHCAFSDVRYFWNDGGTTTNPTAGAPLWGWIGFGGDTYDIDSPSDSRIGQSGPNSTDFFGLSGHPSQAGAPTPPSGGPGAVTTIRGHNFASCSADSSKAHVNGGYTVGNVFSIYDVNYLTLECVHIDNHNGSYPGTPPCTRTGPSPSCVRSFPGVSDYADNGFQTSNQTTHILLQDVVVQGLALTGLTGPLGNGFQLERVRLSGNNFAGWLFDDGLSTANEQSATLDIDHVINEWTGCMWQYPVTTGTPIWPNLCFDDGSAGFGDAWSAQGTGAGGTTSVLSVAMTHSITRYATKDGWGMNHIEFANVGARDAMDISTSQFYGNMGQQVKYATNIGSTVKVWNNEIVGNCHRLSAAFPGAPTGYNSNLSDFCRAAGINISMTTSDFATSLWAFNSITGYATPTFFLGISATSGDGAGSGVVTFTNNLMNGYQMTGFTSAVPIGFLYENDWLATTVRSYNNTYNQQISCPTGNTGEICVSPLLTSQPSNPLTAESQLDNFDFSLTPSSPDIAAGIAIGGITTDFAGNARSNPPAIGALEPSGTPTASTPTFSPAAGSYGPTQTVTISTTSSGAIICYNTTGSPATNGTTGCSAGTLYTSPVSVSTSQTLYAVAGGTGWVDSAVGSAAYVINGAVANPTCTPAAGTYSSAQSVTCSSSTGGSTTTCTTNGSTPTHGSPTCTAISVASSLTLKALSFETGWSDSAVVSNAYIITGTVATPTFSPIAGTYSGTQSITISTITGGASIIYTNDGSTPTVSSGCTITNGTLYSGPVTVASSLTLKAIGCETSFTPSTVAAAAYVILAPTVPIKVIGNINMQSISVIP